MLGYFVKRILQVIPVLLVISFICFMMIRLVPGDPVTNMLGLGASKEAIAAQREELGRCWNSTAIFWWMPFMAIWAPPSSAGNRWPRRLPTGIPPP